MTASEEAAAFLNRAKIDERPIETRAATGDYLRLRELLFSDEPLSSDQEAELTALAEKYRDDKLEGRPARSLRKRQSIGGERPAVERASDPKTASEQAARFLRGYN